MRIIFGTTNPGKLEDVRNLVDDPAIEIKSLIDIGVGMPAVEENGATFGENAILKYDALRPLVPQDYVLVTEDSGLKIDALGGKPGVYSRR